MITRLTSDFRLVRQIRAGRWSETTINNATKVLHARSGHTLTRTWITCLDLRHNTTGVTPSELLDLINLARQRNLLRKPAIALRLAAMAADHDNTDQVTRLLHDHIGKIPTAFELYPHLLVWLDSHHPGSVSAEATRLCRQLLARTRTFEAWLKHNNPEDIAVVGNGPQLAGQQQGPTIDTHDIVIRFNSANTSEPYRVDTGSKISLRTISPAFAKSLPVGEKTPIALTGCNPLSRPSHYWKTLANCQFFELLLFPETIWRALATRLCAPPSAGLLVLETLVTLAQPSTRIHIHGFTTGCHDAASNHYADNQPRTGRHNWAAEADIIRELLGSGQVSAQTVQHG